MTVITDSSQITAEYLTGALSTSGALTVGSVEQAQVEPTSSTWSKMVRVRPRYSPDAQGELPASLLLKMCADTFGPSEVDYCARDYAHLPDAPIPRCYDAEYDAEARAYHILQQDLSGTHRNNFEVAPTLAYAETLAEAVAALHAPYWRADQRAARGLGETSAQEFERYLAHSRQGLEPLLELAADLPDTWRATLHDVFARHPQAVRERLSDPHGVTLIHGDLNPGNILSPRDGVRPVYLIDRQPFDWSLMVWLGPADLAYAIVHWWPTELRRAFEEPMLRRYHAALQAHGVDDYSWERLWDDYRLCAVLSLYVAVEWCVLPEDRERMRWLWTDELTKSMAAYEDLRCGELF